MKEYLLLFRGGLDYNTLSPEQLQANMQPWKSWMDSLAKAGKLGGGERLHSDGAVIKGAERQVVDGPYAEAKEIIGGYILVKTESKQEAIELAKGCPIFENDGEVEVREVAKM
jgi:hypothetical protein